MRWVFRPHTTVLRQGGQWREIRSRQSAHVSDNGSATAGVEGEELNMTLIDSADVTPSHLKFGTPTGRDKKERLLLIGGLKYVDVPPEIARELADVWPKRLVEEPDPPPSRTQRTHEVDKSPATIEKELTARIEALEAQLAALLPKQRKKAG